MHKFLLSLSIFCLSIGFLSAQDKATLNGTVYDAVTNEPLLGVTVRVGGIGTISDFEGNYSLQLSPGLHLLEVSYIGYSSYSKSIRLEPNGTRVDIRLNDDTNLLQQATVTAGKFERPLGEVTVSLDVVKPQFLENNNTTSIDEALDRVPGVNIVDGQANIRGGSGFSYGAGSRVLLLLNDLPALQVDAGFPNWNDFPVENIGQVEVLKGAASALYGSSAMNGIINIRSGYAKNEPETEVASFSYLYGAPKDREKKWWGTDSTNTQPFLTGLSFVHRRKEGKWDLVLSGFGQAKDEYNRETYERYVRVSPNFRYRASERLSMGINTNYNAGKSGSFFIWQDNKAGAFQPGQNSATRSLGRQRYTIDPFVHYFDKSGNRHKLLGRFYSINNKNDSGQGNTSKSYYGEYQFQREIKKIGLVATAGLVEQYSTIDAELYSNAKFSVENTAAYLQLDEKIGKLNLSAGLRYERFQQNSPDTVGGFLVPNPNAVEAKPVYRFGANYQAGQATFIRASWGQGYRFPTIAEKFITTNFGATQRVIPSPSLQSETGWSAELGLKQGIQLGDWKGYADVAFFHSEYDNMMEFVLDSLAIEPKPGGGINLISLFRSLNIGNTKISGVEYSVLGQGPMGQGNMTLWAGYTYLNPRFKDFGSVEQGGSSRPDKNVLKYRYRHTAKFDVEYGQDRWSIGTNGSYHSFMEAVDALFESSFLPGVKEYRDANMHGTFLLDVRAGYQVTKQFKTKVSVQNILNNENPLRPALMGAPITYTLRLEYKI